MSTNTNTPGAAEAPKDHAAFIGSPPAVLGRKTRPLTWGLYTLLSALDSPFVGASDIAGVSNEHTLAMFWAITAPDEEIQSAAALLSGASGDVSRLRGYIMARAFALACSVPASSMPSFGTDLAEYLRTQTAPALTITDPKASPAGVGNG